MDRRVAVPGAVVVLTVTALCLLSATAGPATAQSGLLQTTPEGFADTEFEIVVYGNGSARWTIRASRPLDNRTQVDRFRAFAREFETNETSTVRNFQARARRLVAFGTNATGREMNATAFDRTARVVELGTTRGVVELSFRWTNFARTAGGRVVVDDIFEGGMYVGEGQRLVVARGEGLAFDSVDPPPDAQSVEGNLTASETVTWFGERDFTDRRPRVVLVPRDPAAEGTPPLSPATATATTTPTPAESASGGGVLALVVVVVVLLGLGGGFALYSGAAGDIPRPGGGGDGGAAATPESAGTAPDAATEAPVPEAELISDEDRVLELLEDNGGRMKQVEIVEGTEWSKSKVSMLLSDMEEEGTISKLRVGRENIISKAGHEPEAAGSPFEED